MEQESGHIKSIIAPCDSCGRPWERIGVKVDNKTTLIYELHHRADCAYLLDQIEEERAEAEAEGMIYDGTTGDDWIELTSYCPACGDPIDHCQGHGETGDPEGRAILEAHDTGSHVGCHPNGCEAAI